MPLPISERLSVVNILLLNAINSPVKNKILLLTVL